MTFGEKMGYTFPERGNQECGLRGRHDTGYQEL